MRDKTKRDEVYSYLYLIHSTYFPDLRLMQLICNIQDWHGQDFFYTEDEEMINVIRNYVENSRYCHA